ncbi:hypothetical protein ACFLV7_03455 [Chloroflexota bacterium]
MSDDIKPNAETSPEDGDEFDKSGEVQKNTEKQSFQDRGSDNESGQEEKIPDWLADVIPDDKTSNDVAEKSLVQYSQEDGEEPADDQSDREVEDKDQPKLVKGEQEEDTKEEQTGPLVGVEGVLPAELDPFFIHEPLRRSIKLQVTEAQETQALLLDQMIKGEMDSQPEITRSKSTSTTILRIGIAIFLLISIFLPLSTRVPVSITPPVSHDAVTANQLIESISDGATVLLTVDYEPGFSTEMDAILASVVDRMMLKDFYLVLVSTVPTGPVQGERLLEFLNQGGGYHYESPENYTNLGYIPGGPIGLLNFAEAPRQVIPYDLDGNAAWYSDPMQNISSLSDFDLVVVATENPDRARAWVEQVQPKLGNTPIVLVVSRQAEPLVRPYYGSEPSQIQGLVSGFGGGAFNLNSNAQAGFSSMYWSSFNLALIVGGLLMLFGTVMYAAKSLNTRKPE